MFLLVGGDSEIGKAAAAHLGARALSTTRRPRREGDGRVQLDLAGDLSNWEPPAGVSSACILAAVARLGHCEREPAASARVNVAGTLALAERLIARGVHVLFISSDKVFDGTTPQVPADAPTAPVSAYGEQKAQAEAALRAHMHRGAAVAILRLSKVVSRASAPVRDWHTALAAGRPIHPPAFQDMTMAPVPAATVVRAIEMLMGERAHGTFQLSGPRDVTYLDAALFLAERVRADRSLVLRATLAESNPPKGAGPPHTTLDSRALAERYGITVPEAREVLDGLLGEPGG